MNKQTLILIRGVPGSGKSTLAKQIVSASKHEALHLEADMFFVDPLTGVYKFDPLKLKQAHQWCQDRTLNRLSIGAPVVVSNTFTKLWEMDAYFQMAKEYGFDVQVILAQGQFQNLHGVPEDKVQQMRDRFEYDVSPLYRKYFGG
jgi:predicted kinase